MEEKKNHSTEYEAHLKDWRDKEKTAVELLRIVGELRYEKSVELLLMKRNLYDARPSEVINDHLYAKDYVNQPVDVYSSYELAQALAKLDLAPARIDLARLGSVWIQKGKPAIDSFVATELEKYIGQSAKDNNNFAPRDIVLYGFGRIGRLAARLLVNMTGTGDQLKLKAVVLRPHLPDRKAELIKRASLLRKDSIHGKFRGTVNIDVEAEQLIVNGNRIQFIFADKPEDIDYTNYGIDNALLIDNTGVWRDKPSLSRHLRPGIGQVLFTAPGKGIPNIVYGVNHESLQIEEDKIFCAASCTTNAIVPVLKVMSANFGIDNGHIETIHAYTSSQNLLDNFHKKPRMGRAAPTNMVITSTGAADAVNKALPELEGKLTGSAIRVPSPDGSLAILTLRLSNSTDKASLHQAIQKASLTDLVEQIEITHSNEFVSCDVVGKSATSVFDAPATKISADGKTVVLYVWYDNEFGYTHQVIRLAKYAAKVRRYGYY